ncbi:hypothetical protein NVV94_04755 [Pseudomonas sp. LS1212]|uniref:hypothetical protein n=1 Tax=Pseudomonas sp. LS1212 TaxID=2972478 RepID=UPI00215C5EE3|nr:hypothetical protein [Pseudomonas sp. LS1212]UVJ44897.1 hypothetical protein NVV94_04755 [Pseudomonas sp. LS1212]
MNKKRSSEMPALMAINVGSSSIKTAIFYNCSRVDVNINFIGLATQTMKAKYSPDLEIGHESYTLNTGDDLLKAATAVLNKVKTIIAKLKWPTPDKIGHRVKFAGFGLPAQQATEFQEHILEFNDYLSSRHNKLCLTVIHEAKRCFPEAIQIIVRDQAVNDLSLHVQERIPFEKSHIKRYGLYASGYHGLAIKACLREINKTCNTQNFSGIICHIGSGVSVSAFIEGKAVFNTMQFAACDGPIMHNRSGTQPAGLVLRMLKYGLNSNLLPNILNRRSGIYGLADISPNNNITVESILNDNQFYIEKDTYLLSIATEIFKAVSFAPAASNFVFSGGLATKHKWLAPELLYRAKVIGIEAKHNLNHIIKYGQSQQKQIDDLNITLIDIDEQDAIISEITHLENKTASINFSDGICEVPGTSVGLIKEGLDGWGEGKISLNLDNTAFNFDEKNLPEAYIFSGSDRGEFFVRSMFARSMKVPSIFINDENLEPQTILNKKIYLDTPTRTAIEL